MKTQTSLCSKLLFTTLLLLLSALLFSLPARKASAGSAVSTPPASSQVCGLITAFKPATGSETGSITIGGMSFTIAKGVSLPGVVAGANVCLNFCLDSAGRIAGVSSITISGNPSSICGFVTAFSRSLGGVRGSITIGGTTFRILEGLQLPGQEQAMPGAYVCLTPVLSNGLLVFGTTINGTHQSSLQFTSPSIVNGTTGDGPTQGVDQFLLPQPTVFTINSPAPDGTTVFTANAANFGAFPALQGTRVQGMMLSTPNSTVQALTCTDSFWDVFFQIATTGATEGDMVTFSLQNVDGSKSQIVAMFTLENGAAKLTQLHKDVSLYWGPQSRPVGYSIPLFIPAGSSGLKTPELVLALSPSSASLNGCFQLVAEIKRASGDGKTSLAVNFVQVKRMATFDDPAVSLGTGLFSGALGWYPTGKVCDVVCTGCVVQPQQPIGSLSGSVFCDQNDDGMKQSGESGLAGVLITLTGPVTKTTFTDSSGAYQFTGLAAGTYKITETQPTGVTDGKDKVGSLGGDGSVNDMFSNIVLPENSSGSGYDFGEGCTAKCDTICWRSTQYFLTFFRNLPGGTVLIPGVNANNPVGIQQNLNAVRIALQGGASPMQRLSKEYVTGQLSIAGAGGPNSPVTFNTYWSPLRCSGVSFGEITLSNGFKFTPNSLLNDLVEQTVLAVKNNQSADYAALASIWALLNGRC